MSERERQKEGARERGRRGEEWREKTIGIERMREEVGEERGSERENGEIERK